MNLLKNTHAASMAIDQVATTPGTQPGDRAMQLSALRARIDAALVRLGAEAEHLLSRNPVSQVGGD